MRAYEAGMRAFHAELEQQGSATFAFASTPWDAGPPAYEDWYPVSGWAELGALNEAAVTRARRSHDPVAGAAGWGAGGVWRRVRGDGDLRAVAFAAWLSKPRGEPYADLLARLPEGADVWQRQMVLGPAPEFVLLAERPVDAPAGAITSAPRRVAP